MDDFLTATRGGKFIFNLGHGILPEMPLDHVTQLVARLCGAVALKLAVVLFNLGGPDSPEAVEPFLRNLFSDPAIISLPCISAAAAGAVHRAAARADGAGDLCARSAGARRSSKKPRRRPRALETNCAATAMEAAAFIAMRCWKPFSDEAARAVAAWGPDRIVLLPLYPQFSTTTARRR